MVPAVCLVVGVRERMIGDIDGVKAEPLDRGGDLTEPSPRKIRRRRMDVMD
jgi:hypothetical protein